MMLDQDSQEEVVNSLNLPSICCYPRNLLLLSLYMTSLWELRCHHHHQGMFNSILENHFSRQKSAIWVSHPELIPCLFVNEEMKELSMLENDWFSFLTLKWLMTSRARRWGINSQEEKWLWFMMHESDVRHKEIKDPWRLMFQMSGNFQPFLGKILHIRDSCIALRYIKQDLSLSLSWWKYMKVH